MVRMAKEMIKEPRYNGFFTIDVEDYYHILGVSGLPPIGEWDKIDSRVEIGMNRYFELLERKNIRATLFFLGYIASRNPQLVRRAIELGHEIASHGMYHQEIRGRDHKAFHDDATNSKKLLEDICGKDVKGWRSPGFSIGWSTPWFFDTLIEAGYKYDSSIMPIRRSHKGLVENSLKPGFVNTGSGKIFEFPISVVEIGKLRISMFGGGYLRFFPYSLISIMKDRVLRDYPLTIYVHPREMDPDHPRISMNLFRKFKSYVNMESVKAKLELLLDATDYQTFGDYYDTLGSH